MPRLIRIFIQPPGGPRQNRFLEILSGIIGVVVIVAFLILLLPLLGLLLAIVLGTALGVALVGLVWWFVRGRKRWREMKEMFEKHQTGHPVNRTRKKIKSKIRQEP